MTCNLSLSQLILEVNMETFEEIEGKLDKSK